MKAIAVALLAAFFACPAYKAERRAYVRAVRTVAVLHAELAAARHGHVARHPRRGRRRAARHGWNDFVGPNPLLEGGRGVSYGWGAL